MAVALIRGLKALRAAAACTSRCNVCTMPIRTLRTAAAVEYTVPLDDDEYEHTTHRSPGLTKVPQRDWKTYTRKPPVSIRAHPDDAGPEADDEFDETRHPGFLRQKALRSPTPPETLAHRQAIKTAFPEGWSPPHKLSRQAMDGLRVLHRHDPETFTTPVLAQKFRISPEAVRRILKSRWEPSAEQRARLLRRELRDKEEWLTQRRMAEREELQRLEKNKIREQLKKGHTVGANAKDSLSFV